MLCTAVVFVGPSLLTVCKSSLNIIRTTTPVSSINFVNVLPRLSIFYFCTEYFWHSPVLVSFAGKMACPAFRWMEHPSMSASGDTFACHNYREGWGSVIDPLLETSCFPTSVALLSIDLSPPLKSFFFLCYVLFSLLLPSPSPYFPNVQFLSWPIFCFPYVCSFVFSFSSDFVCEWHMNFRSYLFSELQIFLLSLPPFLFLPSSPPSFLSSIHWVFFEHLLWASYCMIKRK